MSVFPQVSFIFQKYDNLPDLVFYTAFLAYILETTLNGNNMARSVFDLNFSYLLYMQTKWTTQYNDIIWWPKQFSILHNFLCPRIFKASSI